MNILYIVNLNYNNKAGLYNATVNRINQLKKNDEIKLEVVNLLNKDTLIKAQLKKIKSTKEEKKIMKNNEDEIEISDIFAKRGIINSKNFNLYMRQSEKQYIDQLMKFIKNKKIDLIHGHWVYPQGYIAKKISEKLGIPYIVTAHGTDINRLMDCNEELKNKTIETLNDANKIFFVSEALKETALKFGYKGNNYMVTNNGINKSLIKEESIEKKIINSKKKVGFVGSLVEVKGCEYLIPIFKKVNREINAEFVVIGDGIFKKTLERDATIENLDINFKGKLDFEKVIEEMKNLDVVILPSKNEGFGCVILEANAVGVYVVGSNAGGIKEALGECGSSIDLKNELFIENFAKEVIDVLKNGYCKKTLINHAKKFTWDKIIEKEVDIYNSVLKLNS